MAFFVMTPRHIPSSVKTDSRTYWDSLMTDDTIESASIREIVQNAYEAGWVQAMDEMDSAGNQDDE